MSISFSETFIRKVEDQKSKSIFNPIQLYQISLKKLAHSMVSNLEKMDSFKLCNYYQLPKEVEEDIVSTTLKEVGIHLFQLTPTPTSCPYRPNFTFKRPVNVSINRLGQLLSFGMHEV